jgi:hypothetical protein
MMGSAMIELTAVDLLLMNKSPARLREDFGGIDQ